MKKKLSYLYGILLATLLVVIDQVTKYFARTCLTDDKTFDVIKKVLRFNYVKNTGAAWGIFSEWDFNITHLHPNCIYKSSFCKTHPCHR
jgi:signal peptidase II